MAYAYELFDRRRDWPLLDMTAKPIEEAAAEVIAIVRRTPAQKKFQKNNDHRWVKNDDRCCHSLKAISAFFRNDDPT